MPNIIGGKYKKTTLDVAKEKYKLVHSLSDFNDIKKKAIKLLESQKKLKSVNREIMLKGVTHFCSLLLYHTQ